MSRLTSVVRQTVLRITITAAVNKKSPQLRGLIGENRMFEFFAIACAYFAFINIGKWIALREIKNPTGKAIPKWFAEKYQESPF